MTLMLLMLKYLDNMKKTKEIHQALKRREFLKSEIIGLKNNIETLNNRLKTFDSEYRLLNFELFDWDKFNNKTNF